MQESRNKLAPMWWLVLLRGLVDGALLIPFFEAEWRGLEPLTQLVAVTALVGAALELAMLLWMREHEFRGIIRLFLLGDAALGLFLWFAQPVTPALLLVAVGIWLGARSLGVLWLGLSIVKHPYLRAVPVGAGGLGMLVAVVAMLWLDPVTKTVVQLAAAYGAAAVVLHVVIALRMLADKRRLAREARAASSPESSGSA